MTAAPQERALAAWLESGAVPESGWEGLSALVRDARLAPLLLDRGRAFDEASRRGLLGQAAAFAARDLALTAALKDVLGALLRAGIEAVPLRGPALGRELFGDSALSPSGDLDLLVRLGDLPALRTALSGSWREADLRPGFSERFDYTLVLFRDGPPPNHLEPHWSLGYPPFTQRLCAETLWADTRPASFEGLPCRALSPWDLLLHLALHAAHHAPQEPLLWHLQIDALARRLSAEDWRRLVRRATTAGPSILAALVLGKTRALFGTPLPEEGLAALSRPERPEDAAVCERLLRSPGTERLELLRRLSWRERLDFLGAFLWPSEDFLKEQEGAGRGPAGARLRRWARLGRKAAGLLG